LKQFARSPGTTELKLNELAKLHAGKSAQNVIHGLVASEANRLRTYEDLTVKEVAYRPSAPAPSCYRPFQLTYGVWMNS
jgi:AraC family transcriptional activator of pobA